MKFFPVTEFRCGECGYVVWTSHQREAQPGVVTVRCTNRGCTEHSKRFEVQLAAVEGVEVEGGAAG